MKIEWNSFPVAFGVVGSVVVLFMVGMSMGGSDPNDEGDDVMLQRIDAERYCKAEVEARLKAPTTAEYDGVSTTGFGPFTVAGQVSSENSFGAMLANDFACTVTLLGDTWRLDRIVVE